MMASGDWFTDLPATWASVPLKALFRVVGGSTPKSDVPEYWDGDVVWVSPTDLSDTRPAKLTGSLRTITEAGLASCGTTLVPAGSIILSTRAPIGSLGIAEVPLCTNQGCKSLVPQGKVNSFFYLFLLSVVTEQLRVRGKGTTFLELSSDELGSFKVPVPSPTEQTTIAAFLDRETGKIDALVEEQPFMLTANDVQDGFVDFEGARRTTQEAFDDLTAKSRPLSGDVLVTKDGTLGRVALFDGLVACINQSVALLRPDAGTHPAFLALCLRGGVYQDRMVYEAGGTTIKHIYISRLAKMPLARPPLPEQVEITGHLTVVCRRFDQLAAEAEKAIDLLVERRSALIAAAVTGKIDVRKPSFGKTSDRGRFRLIVGAEIVERLAHKKAFGRVKLQKLLYLAEAEAGISELKGEYLREAAGPLDRDLIADVEARLQGHVAVEQLGGPGNPVTYRMLGAKGTYREDLAALLGGRKETLDRVVELLGDLDTLQVEAVTTLYAVWNDALLDGRQPNDGEIISGVLEDWHPEKAKKFRAAELAVWLGWMKRNRFVPGGSGPRTVTGRLFA